MADGSARARLLNKHDDICREARALMVAKNHDYASDSDPFRNFRRHGALGILVRLGDKLARLDSFVENGRLKVQDESIRDTVRDIVNYAILFEAYVNECNSEAMGGNGRVSIRPVPDTGAPSGTYTVVDNLGPRITTSPAMVFHGPPDDTSGLRS